jgi:hypothetical protein
MHAEIGRPLSVGADDSDPDAEPRRLLSIKAAGRVLGGISEKGVQRLVEGKKLMKVKVGHRAFITIKSIDAYVEELEDESVEAGAAA